MKPMRIQPIVEGQGDVNAIPVLLRRILGELHQRYDIEILRPHPRGDLPQVKAGLERFLRVAAKEDASIFCILDFDHKSCIDVLSEEQNICCKAKELLPHKEFEACFLIKEFESLALWDEDSTRQLFPLLDTKAPFPPAPEDIPRDAKGWISNHLPPNFAYDPVRDQQKIAAKLNLHKLRAHSPSFQRLESGLLRLCNIA